MEKFSGSGNSVKVKKAHKDIAVVCSGPGYEPTKQWLESSTDKAALARMRIDGGLTDMVAGAMWVYPDKVQRSLASVKPAEADLSDSIALNQSDSSQTSKLRESNEQATNALQPLSTGTPTFSPPQTTLVTVDSPQPGH